MNFKIFWSRISRAQVAANVDILLKEQEAYELLSIVEFIA